MKAKPPALKSLVRPKNTNEAMEGVASESRIVRFAVSSASQLMLSLCARRRSIDDAVVSTLVSVPTWEKSRPDGLIFRARRRRRPSAAGQ